MCTGNTCRSPMAAALLTRACSDAGLDAKVHSAGTLSWGGPATPYAVDVMAADGIDLQAHRSQQLTYELIASADIVFGMTRTHVAGVHAFTPDASPRSFLLPEFIRLARRIGPRRDQPVDGWVNAVNDQRPEREPVGRASDEIHDPVGESRHVYERTARQLADCAAQLTTLL